VKQYDGLFILNSVGHEDSVDKMIDGVVENITQAGGKVENVDRMETKSFARIADNKYKSGFYFSVIFEISIEGLAQLREVLDENSNVFRSTICIAGNPVPEQRAPAATE